MCLSSARPVVAVALLVLLFLIGAPPQEAPDAALPEVGAAAAEAAPPSAAPAESQRSSALQALRRLPLAFIENRGQVDEQASFYTSKGSLKAYFTRSAIVLQLLSHAPEAPLPLERPCPPAVSQDENTENGCIKGANVFLTFEGASPLSVIEGADPLPDRYNYFLGNDPSKWRTEVPAYSSIRYRGLYPGVDMAVRDCDGRLEYDLILEPAADPGPIAVRCEGAESLRLEEDGTLVIGTAAGPLRQPTPCTYELGPGGTRELVECSYRLLSANRFGFDVPARDHKKALVIDPGLVYGTFLGGSDEDGGYSIAVDSSGAALVTGRTGSSDFPTTPGAYDTTYDGIDAFVAKFSASGSSLLYGTFLGGSGDDYGYAIVVDSSGAALVTGGTWSSDFPTNPGAYDTTYNGYTDAFVAKLSASGSSLLYGTFLGGSNYDNGYAIAVDSSGAALVTGYTYSSNFPTTPGAYDTTFNGYYSSDAFVAKLSASGSTLLYGTFLGGSSDDAGCAIAVDSSGAALVTGETYSSNFPTTPGAYDTTFSGGTDAFVVKLSASGSSLLYGTFLGGSDWDYGYAIAVDSSGAALVTGETFSSNFPTTPGAYDTTFNGYYDVFVAKLSASGSSLLYGTFLGGSYYDHGYGIAVDSAGAALVTGKTGSWNFPTTPGAYDTTLNGHRDAFVAKLSASGSSLLYGTFLGGSDGEWGEAIAVDSAGAALVTGWTEAADFPTTPGAYDTTINGSWDAFVAKLLIIPATSGSVRRIR
ncbi:MAG: SBBP repeat-containing protein [Planctomycetota bacterium]